MSKAHEVGPRAAEDVDDNEMRALLAAVRSGFETICRDPRLPERRHAASRAYDNAHKSLTSLRTLLGERRVATAGLEVARATAAARGRRRPQWLRVVRWPVVIGIGLFDVWYFNLVFRYLTSQTGDAAHASKGIFALWERVAAIVPGIALAIIIATSGELLLRPLHAWRQAAFRRPVTVSGSSRSQRILNILGTMGRWWLRLCWWVLPVAFVLLLLAVIGIWAGLRARYPAPPSKGYPIPSVMLLIVMLALGTMAVKIIAADHEAEQLATARRRLWRLRMAYRLQSRRADSSIGKYDSAWSDLRTLRDEMIGLLRIKMVSAWEGFILRIRSLHRMTGNVTASDAIAPVEPFSVSPEFDGIMQPRVELGPLQEICRLVADRPPSDLRRLKSELDAEYFRQISGGLSSGPPMLTAAPEPPMITEA